MWSERHSLRKAVDKWMRPDARATVRVRRVRRGTRKACKCVRVDVSCREGSLSLAFFLHDNGCWEVYPPAIKRPVMGAGLCSPTASAENAFEQAHV
jgi:hypothetical protein